MISVERSGHNFLELAWTQSRRSLFSVTNSAASWACTTAMNVSMSAARHCRLGPMTLSDEVIRSALAAYEGVAEDYARFRSLTDARGLDQLRDFLRGKRKSLNPEMKARLS